MEFASSLPWKGLIFTGGVLLLLGGSIWWVFLSPLQYDASGAGRLSARLINVITGMIGISAALMIGGGLWDASMHIQTGEVPGGSDFLWPPHLMLYGGFLLALLVATTAVFLIIQNGRRLGINDPRASIRDNPYLGAVALASLFTLISIPGDALWHELVGIDLSAWSPPHVLLALSSCTVIISGVGIFLQQRFTRRTRAWCDLGIFLLFGLMLNILYLIAVLEWELPGPRSPYVEARPVWLYPALGGVIPAFVIILVKRLTHAQFAATGVAATFYLIRLIATTGLTLGENVIPAFPLPFFLGAFLIDLVHWEQIRSIGLRTIALSLTYTLGYAVAVVPILVDRTDLEPFSTLDVILTFTIVMTSAAIFVPLSRFTGRRLVGRQAVH